MAKVGNETNKAHSTTFINKEYDRNAHSQPLRDETESCIKDSDKKEAIGPPAMHCEKGRGLKFWRKGVFDSLRRKSYSPEQQRKYELVNFINTNFHEVECIKFVPDPKQDSQIMRIKEIRCYCGEVFMGHSVMQKENYKNNDDKYIEIAQHKLVPVELRKYFNIKDLEKTCAIIDLPVIEWEPEVCLQNQPAKCFGKINFVNVELRGGKKPAKYVRISANDSVDKLLELMENYWKIMEPQGPSLVISVVGGAKNFKLNSKVKETFSAGLIKAAKTTNAWLITSGFNLGVMKYVGMAVNKGQSFVWHNNRLAHRIRCIAVAPWGYVQDKKTLQSFTTSKEQGKFNADYKTGFPKDNSAPLNANHTHFVFVDDGLRNGYRKCKECAEFRAKFENKLQLPKTQGGKGIPVVLIVIEGGPGAIRDAANSLRQDIPVVICSGTGRAANILSYAYQHSDKGEISEVDLKNKIEKLFGSSVKVNEIVINIKACIEKRHLIEDFHIKTEEDLDFAIMSVLVKANAKENEEQRLKHLELALTWDRVDLAQENLFCEDCLWSTASLEKILFVAITQEKVKFIQLILQQGVVMKEFLTKKRLLELYNEALKSKVSRSMVFKETLSKFYGYKESEPLQMKFIFQLVSHFLNRYDAQFEYMKLTEKEIVKTWVTNHPIRDDELQCTWPYRELLIYSVLLLKSKLAMFALEMGQEPVTSAIAAVRILDEMSLHIHTRDDTLKEQVQSLKKTFEKLAISVLDECHIKDQEKAIMLVERKSPMWSKMSSLEIAAPGKAKAYIASAACQNAITATWRRGIKSAWYKILLSMFFPFLILTRFLEIHGNDFRGKTYSCIGKIILFYTAPVTKFAHYSIGYCMFLLLFTFMLLIDFSWNKVTTIEIICIAWFFTFLVDDTYTVLSASTLTFSEKMKKYIRGELLIFISFSLAFAGFYLHTRGSQYAMITKVLYSINVILLYLKLIKAYAANKHLGPKLIMIKQMSRELLLFLVVLVVFLLAYGVSSQALLYKERKKASWEVLKNVVYHPYWQVFGEIYLEEIESDDSCLSAAVVSSIDTNGTDSAKDASLYCRQEYWLVYFFLAAYLIIGNVLLLNLLIAIFRSNNDINGEKSGMGKCNVFNSIEENSIVLWKYQRYYLVMEFDAKTTLIPPFNILVHVYLFFLFMMKKMCGTKKTRDPNSQKQYEYLELFEKEELTNILSSKKKAEKNILETRIERVQKRVEGLDKVIKEQYVYQLADIVRKDIKQILRGRPKQTKQMEKKSKEILVKHKEKLETAAEVDDSVQEDVANTIEKADEILEGDKAKQIMKIKDKEKMENGKKERHTRRHALQASSRPSSFSVSKDFTFTSYLSSDDKNDDVDGFLKRQCTSDSQRRQLRDDDDDDDDENINRSESQLHNALRVRLRDSSSSDDEITQWRRQRSRNTISDSE